MSNRTAEREAFYASIISTAVEGGTNYWSAVSQYQWFDDFMTDEPRIMVTAGERDESLPESHAGTTATLHPLKDDEDGYEDEGLKVTIDTIAHGFAVLRRAKVGTSKWGDGTLIDPETEKDLMCGSTYRQRLLKAYAECEAGEIDAGDADNIVQLGLFGQLVYG